MYAVRPDGYVSFPMVGAVKADGLTVDEFTAALQQGYLDTLLIQILL